MNGTMKLRRALPADATAVRELTRALADAVHSART